MRVVAYVASLLLMLTLSDDALTSRILNRLTDGSNYLTTQELWFNQTLDHLSLSLSLSTAVDPFPLSKRYSLSLSPLHPIVSLCLSIHRDFFRRYYFHFPVHKTIRINSQIIHTICLIVKSVSANFVRHRCERIHTPTS